MGDILSKSEFARRAGVDPAAISMWISRDQLTAPALRADGMIDVDLAVEQLRARLDFSRSTTNLDALADDEPDGGSESSRGSVIAALGEQRKRQQVEESELRLRKMRRQELADAGTLVDAQAVAASHSKAIEELLSGIEQWLPDLAIKLGTGREGIDLVRREWRAFRQRQADLAADRLSAMSPLREVNR